MIQKVGSTKRKKMEGLREEKRPENNLPAFEIVHLF
jgi:hypothetical protein